MERDGGAIPLLANFEIVEQPTDISKKQIVDLGLLLEGRLDLGKRVFQVPVLVGKGKRASGGVKIVKIGRFENRCRRE